MKSSFRLSIIIFFLVPLFSGAMIDTIVIDPGHGGKDPGAVDKRIGLMEKDINLTIAKYLRQIIKNKLPKMTVHMTRDQDEYVSLNERVQYANRLARRRGIFISIHTNSHENPLGAKKVEGVEVFFYQGTEPEIESARYEGLKKYLTGDYSDPLEQAVSKLINAKLKIDSRQLATHISEGLKIASNEPVRRVAHASFFVVSYGIMPAVLVEVGFISSKKFVRQQYQQKIAKGILLGILSFVKEENQF